VHDFDSSARPCISSTPAAASNRSGERPRTPRPSRARPARGTDDFRRNRFVIYALSPETNISIHVLWGLKNRNTVFATGKSILNRSARTNIGALMLEYGGGGHENAGACQVANEMAEDVLGALIHRITTEG
jgi:hypothetical protein